MVTGLPDDPVGIWPQAYLTSGNVLVMKGSSQPPSNAKAAWPLPSASPHQPEPMSAAVLPRPFLNRSMYHWTAAADSGEEICSVVPSSLTIDPPWAYRNAKPRSRPGLRQIGVSIPSLPLSAVAAATSSSIVVGGVDTRAVLYAIPIVLPSLGKP